MDWTMISQNVALGVVIVVLYLMAVTMGLHRLPLIGVVFEYFMPVAFVVLMTYFRSEQKTKAQAAAEGVFAGCVLLLVLNLVLAVINIIQAGAAG